jgi:glycosyltransferase involved in cell wall biosynthesis
MKVLHLSTWQTGGAAIASSRLSKQLNQLGINSHILNMSSKFPAYIDAVIGKLTRTTNPIFHSYNYYGENISQEVAEFNPDVIHVHWIGAGFVTPESLAKCNLPIVWTLHDLWPLCGAEHLPGSNRFEVGYTKNNRPRGESGLDLDRLVWERKVRVFPKLPLTFVAPSTYLEKLALKAKLGVNNQVVQISNGVDVDLFSPDKKEKKTILFVAMNPDLDPNKGYADFKQAIALLPKNTREKYSVRVVGGEVTDEGVMADLYRGAVVTVIPSRMENLPFVAMESLACGTPVVAYNVGGIPDLVEHGKNGYLAKPYDVEDLSKGIRVILSSVSLQKDYGQNGRNKILKSFNLATIAKNYLELYEKLI